MRAIVLTLVLIGSLTWWVLRRQYPGANRIAHAAAPERGYAAEACTGLAFISCHAGTTNGTNVTRR